MPDEKNTSKNSRATKRLRQVSNHLNLPPDYADVRAHISTLKSVAATPDPSRRGYIRQKQAGKLWVRERLEHLLDANSFEEIGSLSGKVTWEKTGPIREKPVSFTPSNNVQGFGKLRGRKILLTADDFSLRGGHADGSLTAKTIHGEKLALALKVPVVKLVDGSSGGGSVTTIRKEGWSYLPYVPMFHQVIRQLNEGIPNVGAVLGPAIGLGAARVTTCHFSVMAADVGSLFNAGPEVVKGATFEEELSFQDLGGPMIHCTNGTIDNMAANEAECFEQLRTVLTYLPNCGRYNPPPVTPCDDPEDREDEALRSIIPRKQTRMYNPWTIIRSVVDRDSFFEIGALWGRTAISGLARLGGRPVGVISLNCEVNSGALDASGSQKLARLLKLCDVMNLPVLQFIDVPGYAIGTVAERTATMRWGIELAKTYFSTTTPIFNVITRRAYGVAGGVMLGARDPVVQVAWPSGQWGSLPLEGGIEVGHRHELREAEQQGGVWKKKERYDELEEEYRRLMNPVRTANAFGVEEIIDPKDTRGVVCSWARHIYEVLMPIRLAERAAGRIVPVFS
ncbi:acyl-CoA carboxylase subunit beta [Aspergillus undulatus]|uniref:acyl-CoA carboxylase subunit beta n=1 Tax=Aspergillus undulatus TaxID=1810928 RepID=UPI003CCDD610